MQTIQQNGAEAQKQATQSSIDTRTVVATQVGTREKRTWVGKTAITCKKGTVTLHMSDSAAQCPTGFHKS
jgi:hypothetical protein